MNITIEVYPPMLNTTIYLVENNYCVLVDPADPQECIYKLTKNQWIPVGILLTHSHFDHMSGVGSILEKYPQTPIYINTMEKEALFKPELNLSAVVGKPFSLPSHSIVKPVPSNIKLKISPPDTDIVFQFKCLHVPGHSVGSTLYEFVAKDNKLEASTYLATGDFLFEGTIGRTDLAGGSSEQIQASLEHFKTIYESRIEEPIIIIPGHAANMLNTVTTLEKEFRNNPYLYRM
jgi:glyoxylase-like metal-dependent hydrolase (beta-lactamase superfamily II)